VLDGRDIGTVICPEADVKIFVTATPEERARRRFRELAARGETTSLEAVLDGRDIGTVICPDATVKIFVTATPEERARRRFRELAGRGEDVTMEAILDDIRRRDARDSGRSTAPLTAAPDARLLDTSSLDIEQAFRAAVDIVDRAQRDKS
jgi:cytidylate kinase